MKVTLSGGPLAALIAGVLILIVPRLLNYIITLCLILIEVPGLFGAYASPLCDRVLRLVHRAKHPGPWTKWPEL